MKKETIKIIKNEKEPIPTEIIEQSIVDISEGMKRIQSGRLSRRAITVLIKDACGVSMGDIERVLNSLSSLERIYLK